MHLAKPTTAALKRTIGIISSIFISSMAIAQENSPYSRYGIGDITPNQNMLNRGMGGISAGYADFQSINLVNPAALGNLRSTVFDLGANIDIRNLKSNTSPDKFKSVNTLISYLQVGFPIASEKFQKKGNYWGVSFGLRPVTRINYKVERNERLANIDSLNTIYEGNGGITQANISTGIKIKNFSFGASTGYSFGSKDYSTKLNFINDSLIYYKSNTATQTQFGGVFLNLGAQYEIKTKNRGLLRLGAYANLKQNLSGERDNIAETFAYDGNGGTYSIDTVSSVLGAKGKLNIPATYGAGFTFNNDHWTWGADVEMTGWDDYRYYGQKDAVQNTFTVRAGAQYFPAKVNTPYSKYWSFVKYRAGFYYGNDYIKLDDKNRAAYGFTFGAGLPLTKLQRNSYEYYRDGDVVLNTGVEIGARGNKESQSLREGIIRFSVGVSMNARWFMKPKYD
ncbi:MAG: hypothetical protein EOP53_10525 [Sphingobacteriales bacterium]|nr:MAG: hypothetical protein EOP53_10525 [Sphingobacteriales bacterium]